MSDSTNDSAAEAGENKGWWGKLAGGLKRTSSALGTAIADIVTKGPMDPATLDEIEEALIRSDLGLEAAARVTETISRGWYNQAITAEEVKGVIADHVEKVLGPVARPLVIDAAKPFVILVVGVNGSGKTTLIGKLAAKFAAEGRKVVLAAGDTFRAAAIDQLKIWGTRAGAKVVAGAPGADAAGLAFDALSQAKSEGADVLIVDTAGRLQNRAELMDELEKIVRVMKKVDAQAPHAVILVLDATVGQNALSQVELFQKICRRHRPRHDQARRHRARRHPGRHRAEVRAADPFHRRRRGRRRSGAVLGQGLRQGDRGDRVRMQSMIAYASMELGSTSPHRERSRAKRRGWRGQLSMAFETPSPPTLLPQRGEGVTAVPRDVIVTRHLDPRTRTLLEAPILPTLLRLAIPNLIMTLVQGSIGLIDIYFMAKLGTDAVAGVSLVFPGLMLMQMMAGGAMGGGISSAVARALGSGRRDDADAIVLHALVIGAIFAAFFSTAVIAGGPWLVRRLGGRGAVLDTALTYSNTCSRA